jgi:hypothetical protein
MACGYSLRRPDIDNVNGLPSFQYPGELQRRYLRNGLEIHIVIWRIKKPADGKSSPRAACPGPGDNDHRLGYPEGSSEGFNTREFPAD